jgi:DNA-binding NarL/FixJ family response regulator
LDEDHAHADRDERQDETHGHPAPMFTAHPALTSTRCPAPMSSAMTRWSSPVLVAGSEKAAAHRLGLSHSTVKHHLANARSKVGAETTAQLVWILAARLPEPEGMAEAGE